MLRENNLKKNSCYLIAEIGVNHNGDMNLATKMIDAAKESGADAVKFQTFTAENLVSQGTPKVKYQESTTSPNETHYEMIQKLELKRKDHFMLKSYCESKNISFLSTPYDLDSAKFLNEELNVKAFKTASADLVDLQLQEYISLTGKVSIVSVGMATMEEIREVTNIYKQNKNDKLSLLHCVSNYPCSDESLNLKVIKTIRDTFNVPVGYSDHSLGFESAVVSVAYGANIIEKHFTLDKNLPGPDHLASSTPDEFTKLVSAVRRAEIMLGNPIKNIQEEEMDMAKVSRKSIVAVRNLEIGDIIKSTDLTLKRPGTGLMSKNLNSIIGRKIIKRVSAGKQIHYQDIS